MYISNLEMHISRLEIQFLSSFGHFFCLVHAFFARDSESFSPASRETGST